MSASPTNVFLLGCRGAGKTSFMLGLSLLSRPGNDSPFRLVSLDGRTATAVTELRSLAERLEWPPPTSSIVPLEFELSLARRSIRLSVLDYPGEDLLDAMETLDFSARELMLERVVAADCLLILVDPTQDLFTPLNGNPTETRRRQDAIAQAVGALARHRTDQGGVRPIIALAITKADLLDAGRVSVDDAVSENAALIDKLAAYARQGRPVCFGVSACGDLDAVGSSLDGRAAFPASAEPAGYEALFEWLTRTLQLRKRRMLLWATAAIMLLMIVAGSYWTLQQAQQERRWIERIESASLTELREDLGEILEDYSPVDDAIDRRVAAELEEAREDFQAASTPEKLERLRERVETLVDLPSAHHEEAKALSRQIDDRVEEGLWSSLQAAWTGGDLDNAIRLAREYLQRFPNGRRCNEVAERVAEFEGRKNQRRRESIASIPVTGKTSLLQKRESIEDYLDTLPKDDSERDSIKSAVSLASRVCAADVLRLRVVRYGYSGASATDHKIKVLFGSGGAPRLEFESPSSGTWATVDRAVQIAPPNWPVVRFEVWERRWLWRSDEKIASGRLDILQDLRQFDGKTRISLPNKGSEWRSASAWVKLSVELRTSDSDAWTQVTPEELESYGRFIAPGDHW